MNGKDLFNCANACDPCAPVYFMDKDGNIHEVYSFKRVRSKESGRVNLLMEIGAVIRDFGDLRTERPPKELVDYMNEKYGQD